MKTKLFIDTEFNSFGGELISMAIIDDEDKQFYEALNISSPITPWVQENVIPILGTPPIPLSQFQKTLESFLKNYPNGFTLIADWPEDIKHFMDVLITAPGTMMDLPPFQSFISRELALYKSNLPHNALEDAKAIRSLYQEINP